MAPEFCPECRALVSGGRSGCQALFDRLTFQATEDGRIAAIHSLAFDTYCMQHVETYCVSAKSYIAHLTRLCVGVEYGGSQTVYDTLQRWFGPGLMKPDVLATRGRITIVDVQFASTVENKVAQVHAWAQHVWDAYASQHQMTRRWVHTALNQKKH